MLRGKWARFAGTAVIVGCALCAGTLQESGTSWGAVSHQQSTGFTGSVRELVPNEQVRRQRTVPLPVSSDELSWDEIAEKLYQPPVDARVDRVWRAIPGLSGWKLNIAASRNETARHRDGQVHLLWASIPPTRGLSQLPPEPVYRGPKQEQSATLMFNVSWGEEYIPQILDTLARNHLKATFFLDGAWVKKNPELAKRIADAGHNLGTHGQGHPDFRRLSAGQLEQQISRSAKAIQEATQRNVDLIAPPSGSFDSRLVKIASRHDMHVIMWTVDTVDWRRPPANQILRRVSTRIEPGSLILMHPTASTARALPDLIGMLKEKGYVFKTVEQVIAQESVVKPPATLRGRP